PTLGQRSSEVSCTVAPNLFRIFFVSSLTLSGITISTLYPSAWEMPVKAIPVFPDVGSIIMLLSFFNSPFLSASFTIQYAAVSFYPHRYIFFRIRIVSNYLYHVAHGKSFHFNLGTKYRLGTIKSSNVNGFGRRFRVTGTHMDKQVYYVLDILTV